MVYTYYRYVTLIDSIFFLFQVEANPEARTELTRLIGVLGALDCFYLFKNKALPVLSSSPDSQPLITAIKANHKASFFFESSHG